MGKLNFSILLCWMTFSQVLVSSQLSTILDQARLEILLDNTRKLDSEPIEIEVSCYDKYRPRIQCISTKTNCKLCMLVPMDKLISKKESVSVIYDGDNPVEIRMSNVLEFQLDMKYQNYAQPKVPGYTYLGTIQSKYGIFQFYQNVFSFELDNSGRNQIIGLQLQNNLT